MIRKKRLKYNRKNKELHEKIKLQYPNEAINWWKVKQLLNNKKQITMKTTKKHPNKGQFAEHTIPKHRNYMNDVYEHLLNNNSKFSAKDQIILVNKHNVSWNVLNIAVKLGYIDRLNRGEYKFIEKITDEEIRKIIRLKNDINLKRLKLKDIKRERPLNSNSSTYSNNNTEQQKKGRPKYTSHRKTYVVINFDRNIKEMFRSYEEALSYSQISAGNNPNTTIYICEIKTALSSKTSVFKIDY